MGEKYKIELREITKDFSGVRALDHMTVRIRPGTVHALVGENGAGKSTLMKILNGLYKPNGGEIYIDGTPVQIKDPIDAREKGIAMIYQELNYIPDLTIEENIFMGRFPNGKAGCFVDWKKVRKLATEFLNEQKLDYDPAMLIKHLSVSEIQMLEIIKAVSFNASVVIMDEPTSAITNREVDRLFEKIEEMKKRGISIVYISHKMDEIFRIADDITVIRDGKGISTGPASDYTQDKLISQMVGREIKNLYPKEETTIGAEVLRVEDLSSEGLFENIGLSIRQGEVVGLAGLVGAGRTELASALSGHLPVTGGKILLNGKEITIKGIPSAIEQGIIMVSEDRRKYGIVGCLDVLDNTILADHCVNKDLFAGSKRQIKRAKGLIQKLNVKTPSLNTQIQNLSGGNQQKVVLSKWLMLDTKVLILDEPTRGIDVGAKYEIYKIIGELAKEGCAILVISSEIPELMGIADRVYVMSKGHMKGQLDRNEFSQEEIMRLAIGGVR